MDHATTQSSMTDGEMFDCLAKGYNIDQRTGFMCCESSLGRLPQAWEIVLDAAMTSRLHVGDKLGLLGEDRTISR